MARKTISVDQIRANANRALSDPDVLTVQDRHMTPERATAYREGVAAVLESVLMESGNYRGFAYADPVAVTFLRNNGALPPKGDWDETIRTYH